MKEKNKLRFYDTESLTDTPGLIERAGTEYLERMLNERFPSEKLSVVSSVVNRSGKYSRFPFRITGLPHYISVKISHTTGRHTETITVWSPLAWNDRFVGTGGGGTSTGGESSIMPPDNTSRGMTLPKAVVNGFTAAATDGGNMSNEWAIDRETGMLDWERIENWRASGTHFMTRIGKAVSEILHQRPVAYSYFHGGSGGGRQAMVEAQEFPEDYNGIWASCPAINWSKFVISGLWPLAVMTDIGQILSPEKIRFFMTEVHESVGGPEVFYTLKDKVSFDPFTLVGRNSSGKGKSKGSRNGVITTEDAKIMQMIWQGPHKESGEKLWYGFRPGVHFWNVGIPIGAFYYSLFTKKPKPFVVARNYARWITLEQKRKFDCIDLPEFFSIFEKSVERFAMIAGDKADLKPFMLAGGKLIIDHGTEDPLIPVDGTLDYFSRMSEDSGGSAVTDSFVRLFITPGDGHGHCSAKGPGITESDGMTALISWVEKGIAPDTIRGVLTDRKGNTIKIDPRMEHYRSF